MLVQLVQSRHRRRINGAKLVFFFASSLKYDVKGRVKICIVFVSFYRNNFHEGDMGNLRQSNAGVIDAELSLPAMVLEGDNGVIGRAVVVSIIVCFCFVLFCFLRHVV